MVSRVDSTKHLKKLIDILPKLFQKTEEEGTFPNSFYKATIILKTKPTKPDKDITRKENYRLRSLMNNEYRRESSRST